MTDEATGQPGFYVLEWLAAVESYRRPAERMIAGRVVLQRYSYWIDSKNRVSGYWLNQQYDRSPRCNTPLGRIETGQRVYSIVPGLKLGYYAELMRAYPAPLYRQDVVTLWQASGFTGFEAEAVRLDCQGHDIARYSPLPRYYHLQVTGRAEVSAPPVVIECEECGARRYNLNACKQVGIRIKPGSWDGSDMFLLSRPYETIPIVSHRLAHATLAAGFNQAITFVRAERWRHWEPFDADGYGTPPESVEWHEMLERVFLIRRAEDL